LNERGIEKIVDGIGYYHAHRPSHGAGNGKGKE